MPMCEATVMRHGINRCRVRLARRLFEEIQSLTALRDQLRILVETSRYTGEVQDADSEG